MLELAISVLNDDLGYGISEKSYHILCDCLKSLNFADYEFITNSVKETEGRYYLPAGVDWMELAEKESY